MKPQIEDGDSAYDIEDIYQMQNRIEELEQQNAEFKVHVEDSKHVMMVVANCDTKENANVIADKWIEQTPEQSLNNIKADAIEEAVKECMLTSGDVMVRAKVSYMMYYANKLRGDL